MSTQKTSPVVILGLSLLVWLAPILFIIGSNAIQQGHILKNYWWSLAILVNAIFYLLLILIPYFILRNSFKAILLWILVYSVIFSAISAIADFTANGPSNFYLLVMMLFLIVIFIHASVARRLKR